MSAKGPPEGLAGLSLLWWAARNPPAEPTTSYSGKTVLITGANSGLGFEAAVKYAALGASSLILGVRTVSKGEEAKAAIVQHTGCQPSSIRIFQIDMSTFSSVREFARTVSNEVDVIDVAVLNAGIASASYKKSPEGWEMSLQVNVLSTALLGILLLPKLRETARKTGQTPHLEITGSAAHKDVKAALMKVGPDENLLEKLNSPSSFSAATQYGVTKLLVMYIMQGLVDIIRRWGQDPEVIVTTVCPGLCRSELGKSFPFILRVVVGAFQRIFARSSEQGSRSMVSGTSLGTESHGKFWNHDIYATPGDLVTTEEGHKLQKKAWGEMIEVLRKHAPEIDDVLRS